MAKNTIKNNPEVFTPDTVQEYLNTDGSVPEEFANLTLRSVAEESIFPAIAGFEAMDGLNKRFTVETKGAGAYWVGEGERIQTDKAEWKQVEMAAHKVAVILPTTNEFLNWGLSDYFNFMTPKVAKAFAKAIDEALILNVENPFKFSMDQSATAANQVIDGGLTTENIFKAEDMLADGNHTPTDFIGNGRNTQILRHAVDQVGDDTIRLYDRQGNTLDGIPVHDLRSDKFDKETMYLVDNDLIRYGIPQQLEMKISDSAQLSTVKASDGGSVNLFEQDMVATRYTMYFGAMIIDDSAVVKIQKGAAVK